MQAMFAVTAWSDSSGSLEPEYEISDYFIEVPILFGHEIVRDPT